MSGRADEILVVTSGGDEHYNTQMDAVRLDADGNTRQHAQLSIADGYPYDVIAAGDESQWLVAWRVYPRNLIVIAMPHGDLGLQSRTSMTLPGTAGQSAVLGDIAAGSNPAVVWMGNTFVHAIFILTQIDAVLGQVARISDVRVIDGEVFCRSGGTSWRIVSIPLSGAPPPPREQVCVAGYVPIEYDVRNGDVDAIVYLESNLVRLQPRAMPRRRAAH